MADPQDVPLNLDVPNDQIVPGSATTDDGGRASYVAYDPSLRPTPHLQDYLKVIHKRRWLVVSTFLIVAIGTVVSTFTEGPLYQARAKLLIEVGRPNYVSFEQVVEEGAATIDYYQTQYDLLKSRSLARKTVESLNLIDGVPSPRPGRRVSLTGLVDAGLSWVRGLFGTREEAAANAPPVVPDATVQVSRAIDSLLATLTVAPVRNSRIVNLICTSPDPTLAMDIVNAHAKAYVEQNAEFKFVMAQEASDWLAARLAEQRKQVQEAEAALQRYREEHDAIPPEDTENIVVQKLTQLNSALTTAKTTRLAREAVYTQLKAVQNSPAALETFPAILTNPAIQARRNELVALRSQESDLSQKFGPNHPELKKLQTAIAANEALVENEINNVIQSVRNEYEAALANERSLSAALEAQKVEALTMSKEAIQFGVLRREVDSTRQVFQNLLERAKETGVSLELRTTNVRIVDLAELPRSPSSPNRRFNLSVGLLAGLALGLCLGFFVEYLDNRIKTPDDIKTHLGLPALGLLPLVRDIDAAQPFPLVNGTAPPALVEAFRTLRTNLVFSSVAEGLRSLVITSAGPSEGKTMVSANLAVSLAEAGQRVLLIDADLRRPKQHEIFRAKQQPGLSNLLVASAKASETVRKTSVRGLWLLPAGRIPPNPAELIGSKRFRDFLLSLRDHFDWVVIDTPPVMAVTDASVAAHQAGAVAFVVGAEMTSRAVAQAAIEQLDNARAHVVGGILNRVDLKRQGYYYSQYYRREYSKYYAGSTS